MWKCQLPVSFVEIFPYSCDQCHFSFRILDTLLRAYDRRSTPTNGLGIHNNFLIWGFLIHVKCSFCNQLRIYFRLSHKCNHSTLHCKSGFYQYGEHGKTYIFARLKWCISMFFFRFLIEKRPWFLQDYTTDTYLRQKWTDPRLASADLKV